MLPAQQGLPAWLASWVRPLLYSRRSNRIDAELEGKAAVIQVEVSEAPETAGTYGLMGVPTLMVFVGGEPKETLAGSRSKVEILKALRARVPA